MRRAAACALLLAACGGTVASTPDGGTTLPKEPKRHRPVPASCDATRPTTGDPQLGLPGCQANSECTGANARCVFDFLSGKNVCSADECGKDTECSGTRVCACRLPPEFLANRCFNGNCRTDGDCGVLGKGYCSPSADQLFKNCPLPEPGSLGYFCHDPADECVDDVDCGGGAPGSYCVFSPQKGHFSCISPVCTK
jgi:hypothetical protein